MSVATFPSLDDCEVIEVDFIMLTGETQRRRLLVDSGFTGSSSLILSDVDDGLVRAKLDNAPAVGALQGDQKRGWVTWRVPRLGLQNTSIAIIANLEPLSLPSGVLGMVGLTFLRNFTRWGAERTVDGWRFCLSAEFAVEK
ncbi:MAG TPA: hypothetical protein VKD71_15555 [Gemmataceae bacterium]|nr:hypothetical protein [Gemmataceae bacterium]